MVTRYSAAGVRPRYACSGVAAARRRRVVAFSVVRAAGPPAGVAVFAEGRCVYAGKVARWRYAGCMPRLRGVWQAVGGRPRGCVWGCAGQVAEGRWGSGVRLACGRRVARACSRGSGAAAGAPPSANECLRPHAPPSTTPELAYQSHEQLAAGNRRTQRFQNRLTRHVVTSRPHHRYGHNNCLSR